MTSAVEYYGGWSTFFYIAKSLVFNVVIQGAVLRRLFIVLNEAYIIMNRVVINTALYTVGSSKCCS